MEEIINKSRLFLHTFKTTVGLKTFDYTIHTIDN